MSPASRRQQRITFAILAMAVWAFSLLQSLSYRRCRGSRRRRHRPGDGHLGADRVPALGLVATPIIGRIGDSSARSGSSSRLAALTRRAVLAAAAPSIEWLIVARVVQGAGGGCCRSPSASSATSSPTDDARRRVLASSRPSASARHRAGRPDRRPSATTGCSGCRWSHGRRRDPARCGSSPSRRAAPERLPLVPALLLASWLVALLLR